jgi:hypothetical protein
MASYAPDSAVGRRIATLRYDVLSSPPTSAIDLLEELDRRQTLASTSVEAIAELFVSRSIGDDGGGSIARAQPSVTPSIATPLL